MKKSNTFTSRLFLLSLLVSISTALSAQFEGLPTLEEDETLFVDGISSNVLSQGRAEVNAYSALFSFWQSIHATPTESIVRDRVRVTEFITNVEAYYGFSNSGLWDIGLRLRYGRRRVDNAAQNSPFKVFEKVQEANAETQTVGLDQNYTGTKEVGIRFRMRPIASIPQLSFNLGYSFVPNHEEEVQQHLNADRNSFDLNVAYYVALNDNASSFYYFILNGIAYSKGTLEINQAPLYQTAASFYIVQRLGKVVLYPGLSYSIGFKKPDVIDKSLVRTNEQVLGVLGAQYQATDNLSLNLSTAIPFLWETPNLLNKPVRQSFSFVSIGGRILF